MVMTSKKQAPVQYPELEPDAIFRRSINHPGVNPKSNRAEVLNMVMQGLTIFGSNHRGMGMHVRFQDICFSCGGVPAVDLPCNCGKRVLYRVFYHPEIEPGLFGLASRVTIPWDVPTGDKPTDGWYEFLTSPDEQYIRNRLTAERLRTG